MDMNRKISEEMAETLKKPHSQFSKFHITFHRTYPFTRNIDWFSILQAVRYRKEGDRILRERRRVRTDTWSNFRV